MLWVNCNDHICVSHTAGCGVRDTTPAQEIMYQYAQGAQKEITTTKKTTKKNWTPAFLDWRIHRFKNSGTYAVLYSETHHMPFSILEHTLSFFKVRKVWIFVNSEICYFINKEHLTFLSFRTSWLFTVSLGGTHHALLKFGNKWFKQFFGTRAILKFTNTWF